MSSTIVQINFTIDMPVDTYNQMVAQVAEPIAAVDGLLWKVWLMNEADHEAGGIYLFKNAAAAQAYLTGPIISELGKHPQIKNISAKMFSIAEDLTAITHGPVHMVQN